MADSPSISERYGRFRNLSLRLDDIDDRHAALLTEVGSLEPGSGGGSGGGSAGLTALTLFDEELDIDSPIPDGFGEDGDVVVILDPTSGNNDPVPGLYILDEDRRPVFETALFDGSHDGALLWVYQKYAPDLPSWTREGPFLYGIYASENPLAQLSGPGMGRSGMTMLDVTNDEEGEDGVVVVPDDGHLVYDINATSDKRPTYVLPDPCGSAEFYLFWNSRPEDSLDFDEFEAEFTNGVSEPWGNSGDPLYVRFIPNTVDGGYLMEAVGQSAQANDIALDNVRDEAQGTQVNFTGNDEGDYDYNQGYRELLFDFGNFMYETETVILNTDFGDLDGLVAYLNQTLDVYGTWMTNGDTDFRFEGVPGVPAINITVATESGTLPVDHFTDFVQYEGNHTLYWDLGDEGSTSEGSRDVNLQFVAERLFPRLLTWGSIMKPNEDGNADIRGLHGGIKTVSQFSSADHEGFGAGWKLIVDPPEQGHTFKVFIAATSTMSGMLSGAGLEVVDAMLDPVPVLFPVGTVSLSDWPSLLLTLDPVEAHPDYFVYVASLVEMPSID